MKTKKICIDGLEKVLYPKEMKNITGGSGWYCCEDPVYPKGYGYYDGCQPTDSNCNCSYDKYCRWLD